MTHCAACCGKMAKSAMTSPRMHMVQAPRLAEFSAPPCCKISSDDTTTPVTAREAQRPVTQAVAHQAVSVLLPRVAPDSRQRIRPLPGPSPKSRPQSALCTFLI
jgi:hypothetical protein